MTTRNPHYEVFDMDKHGRGRDASPNVNAKFTLKAEHLTLLQHAYVQWQDDETGAPEIDPKRPYGNSSVSRDVADILGLPQPDYDTTSADDYDKWENEMLALHKETTVALQIVLANLPEAVTPGVYVCEEYTIKWRRLQ